MKIRLSLCNPTIAVTVVTASLTVILATPAAVPAQTTLPDTPQGAAVREYIRVFNGNNEADTRQFLLTHISKEGLAASRGGTSGVNAIVNVDAATQDIIVVLSNYDPPSAETMGRSLSGYLRRLK